jgi:hypothetical protein
MTTLLISTAVSLTYRALIERILTDDDLPMAKRQDVAAGLRSFTKALHVQFDIEVPALPELRKLIAGFAPAMVNMKPGRWRNIRGHLQFALAHAGLATVPRRYQIKPSPRWTELLAPLEYAARYKLSHIARYCTANGIEPKQLDHKIMSGLLDDLRHRSLKAEPERVHRDAAVAWNKQVENNPAWPQNQLKVADNRGHYSVPWERFPESLRADVDRWLDRLSGKDLRSLLRRKPLRPESIKTRKRQLHEYLSALVLEGTEPATMLALKDLVTPDIAAKGMMFFWKRAGEKPSVHAGQVAGLVLAIARHHAKLDQTSLDDLRDLSRRISKHQTGMTDRNRTRLRPLDDPDRVEDLGGAKGSRERKAGASWK